MLSQFSPLLGTWGLSALVTFCAWLSLLCSGPSTRLPQKEVGVTPKGSESLSGVT